jgi:hypothetical protein
VSNPGPNSGSGGGNRRRRPASGRSGGQGSAQPRSGSSGRSSPASRRTSAADFWGRPAEGPPAAVEKIRPAVDPAALPRSLGDPPLGPNPAAAAHHLAVIYEEAVRAGTALAAASGLVADEDLPLGDTPA